MRLATCVTAAALVLASPILRAQAAAAEGPDLTPHPSGLPFLGEEARKRGYELPQPFGVGLVYYKLNRDIVITDVRVGRNGNTPVSVPDAVDFGSTSNVDNYNLKADVWLLPFLNVYAIAGRIENKSTTHVEITLPPLTPAGSERRFRTEVPTQLSGSVGGLGITLAGGVGSFFGALDVNGARADLGFDNKFKAVVSSARVGWNGQIDSRPFRTWVNATYWNTFAVAKGTVTDPDGGTLAFEVDQGPKHPWTYGAGFSYAAKKWLEFSFDAGVDKDRGWYVAIVPVIRF